jgi:signal transduction histidine kinase
MLDLDRPWQRPRPTPAQMRTDVVVALALAVVSVASVEVWRDVSQTSLGWKGVEGFIWFGLAGLALAGRRRFPLTTLLVESAIFIAVGERVVGLAGIFTIQMILFAAVYAAWAWSRHTRTLFAVTAAVVVAMFGWLIYNLIDQMPANRPATDGVLTYAQAVVTYSLAINVVYFFGAIAWGHVAWRSARQRTEIAAQAVRERESQRQERENAVQAERVRIARDLHDVVAHHVSSIGVQAAGAGRMLSVDQDASRTALSTIEQSSRQAVSQMHQLVGLLRSVNDKSPAEREPRPGLANLASLATTDSRPVIGYREVGEPFEVPRTVQLSLFRIAQEAVANLRRHARAGSGSIVLRYVEGPVEGDPAVEVEIIDDGSAEPASSQPSGGFGLAGIRERAAMHGGVCDIGPRPEGGFRVRVRIPVVEA